MAERLIPPMPNIVRGVPLTLGADPNGVFLLYTNGLNVVLRNMKEFCRNEMCIQHTKNATCAKYSPSGYHIASADQSGKVVIWDTVNPEHIARNDFTPFSGPINDLMWTADNQRIIAGGKGVAKRGGVYNAETGSTISSFDGVSVMVNSVDIRPTKPPRAIVGDLEGSVTYYEGYSYDFKRQHRYHKNSVNAVRFSPTGEVFLSAASDGKIFLYRSDDGEMMKELGNPAHKGTIYNLAFSRNGSRFVSSSADKSLKLWALEGEDATCLSHFSLSNVLTNMIQGCCWVGDTIAAITFGGSLHLFDAPEGVSELKPPRAVLFGHVDGVTCACYDTEHGQLLTGSPSGVMASWNLAEGTATPFDIQAAKSAAIVGMVVAGDTLVCVVSNSQCILSVIGDPSTSAVAILPSGPHSVGIIPDKMLVVVGCESHVVLLSAADHKLHKLQEHAINLEKHSLAVSPRTGTALFCSEKAFTAFKVCDGKLMKTTLTNSPPSLSILASYSPDGSMVALVNIYFALSIYHIDDHQDSDHSPTLTLTYEDLTQRHTARVTAMAWSPDSKRIATAGMDTCIAVLTLGPKPKKVTLKDAHPKQRIISLSWTDNNSICSVSPDGSIRCWKVPAQ